MKNYIQPIVAGFSFYVFLTILFYCYRLGFSAPFQFDDFSNLSWLSALDDNDWVGAQIFAGKAGPSGRPIALAAFLVDGYYWPLDSTPFHRTNSLLHLLNGCLLVVLLNRLRTLVTNPPSAGLTILAACAWMALPILVSTVLLTVQRMTLLSATFSLAGITVYLIGRCRLVANPGSGSVLMAMAIVVFTPLAALSKENGALLPLYIAVIESTLLPPLPATLGKQHKIALRLLVAVPVVVLFAYLGRMWLFDGLVRAYSAREFTLDERLQSESVILWEYLCRAFLPEMAVFGPFQDAHPVFSLANHPLIVLFACAAWLAFVVIAWRLYRHTPLPLFAVGWFLSGHLLESTIIPLELYFEHRNYLPLIGPVYALTIGTGHLINTPALRYGIIGVYLMSELFILMQVTQLWGDSVKSAYYWAETQPDSVRATQFLAQQLMENHRLDAARLALERGIARHPRNVGLLLQKIQLQCEARNLSAGLLERTREWMKHAEYNTAAVFSLNALIDLAAAKRCPVLDNEQIQSILDELMQNESFARTVKYHLHRLKARLYEQHRQLSLALEELEAALTIHPTLDTYLRIAAILIDAGYYDAALKPLSDARNDLPENPLVRRYWLRELDAYAETIILYRQSAL